MSFSEKLQFLLSVVDIENNLHDNDRINMYEQLLFLLNDPILNFIKIDVLLGLTEFKNKLINNHDINMLKKLKTTCNLDFYIPEFRPSIYNNKQNVHSYVSETVRIAKILLKLYPTIYERPFNHSFFEIIEKTDLYQTIDLKLLFASVYKFIQISNHKNELMKRLIEEMEESKDLCLSGHICRLVNTLTGFTDDEQLLIKIDEYEYHRAKTFNEINKKIDVFTLDGLNERIQKAVNTKFINIDDKFGIRILSEYTHIHWNLKNGVYTIC